MATRKMSGEDGGLPDSPAAARATAVLARRESRTPIPERLREIPLGDLPSAEVPGG